MTDKPEQVFLTTDDLSARWGIDAGTLVNWRMAKRGPKFTKFGKAKGSRVMYKLDEVIAYEQKMVVKTKEG